MASTGSEEGFKVTDRRRRADEEPSSSPRHIEIPPRPDPRAEAARPATAPGGAHDLEGGRGERDLSGLFVMLATSAATMMGDAPDPMTGQVHRDLGQAAELIDLLVLLREKTEGNRTAEETQVLDEIVYDLQLRYVAATKRSAPPRGPARS
jgi:hypothetical protein